MSRTADKAKVIVLGGGLGSLTTAWKLSEGDWRSRYSEIVVHQVGWRLGGKGATSRSEHAKRIEEHGLHVWLGFYENAFCMLDDVYRELGGTFGPLATIDDAFHPASHLGAEEWRDDDWKLWASFFPTDDRRPWTHSRVSADMSVATYLLRTLELAKTALASLRFENPRTPFMTLEPPVLRVEQAGSVHGPRPGPASGVRIDGVIPAQTEWGDIERDTFTPLSLAAAVVQQGLQEIERLIGALPFNEVGVARAVTEVIASVRRSMADWVGGDDAARRAGYLLDVTLSIARGLVADGLLSHPDGLDAIDDYDLTDWLVRHGCAEESARSGFVRAVAYDLAFAYVDGDPKRPSGSAATALRGMFRLFFTYSGALMWKMNAGMGEVVIAPMYEALRRRGVRFEFFSRIKRLELTEDRTAVARIVRERQVTLREPSGGYQPLIEVHGLRCWPQHPHQGQIVESLWDDERGRYYDLESFWTDWPHGVEETIEVGGGDIVVFGISIGAVPHLCSELLDARAEWATMVAKIRTVQTQALQLWLREPLESLGSRAHDATIGGLTEPFDTYSDMTYLLCREDWRVMPPPRSIGYFCNVMEELPADIPFDETRQGRADDIVRDSAVQFLSDTVGSLWPDAVRHYPSDFDWELLVGEDPDGGGPDGGRPNGWGGVRGRGRIAGQFCRANVSPSERYVQSVPGSGAARLTAGGTGFDNLVVTGDWIQTGLNCGCVEGAVMSGLLAANAVQPTLPPLDEIRGYHHP